jgi:long-chain fatty acid transport protein
MSTKFNRITLLSGISILSLCTIEAGYAAGFYLSEVGTPSSLGTGGVANPTHTDGADTSWSNPAAMSYIDEEELLVGLQVIFPNVEFSAKSATTTKPVPGIPVQGGNGGNAGVVTPVPSVFYVKPLSDDWRFGFSMAGLTGGGYDYGDNFVGRYAIKEVVLAGLGITPSLSYRVNDKLSLGAGVSILYTIMNQEIAMRQPGFSDGNVKFEDLTDWGAQGILSLTYELSDRALLGVVYRSEADVELEGDIKLRNVKLPLPSKGDAAIDWTNPQWLDVGLSYDVSEQTRVFLNAGWQEWSTFSNNYITIGSNGVANVLDRNWDDTWYAGVAAKHKLSDRSIVSLGVSYESSPVEDEFRTMDMALDEMWKLSAAYGWTGGKLDYSIGATLYLIGDAPIDQTAQGVRVVGDYGSNSMLFIGGTLKYNF